MLRIKLIKSQIDRPERQKRTLKALGLKHTNDTVIQPDNPAIRGMIGRVFQLVEVEEIDGD
ncbi:50S ribosomal protein L30 [candidate division WOR-3 bacterium]|nr:50S ribosomal protein L30 [candidate division WOR-3 bacterium]